MCTQVMSILFLCISICNSSEISTCPTETYLSPPHNECVCTNMHGSGIVWDPDTLTLSVITGNICMFFSEELQTTLFGTCPYWFARKIPRNASQIIEGSSKLCLYQHRSGPLCGECEDNYTLPAYLIYEDSSLCSFYNQKGQFCGECAENYTIPANSYYLGCVKCKNYNNGWIKFAVAAFLPLTILIYCRNHFQDISYFLITQCFYHG